MATTTTGSLQRTPHRRSRRGLVALTAALTVLTAAACTADWKPAPWDVELPTASAISELRPASDCADLVDAARPSLMGTASAMWSQGSSWPSGASEDAVRSSGPATTAMPEMSAADAAGSTSTATGSPTVIGTNNQEQGVDEADQVKTDGRRLVSLVNGTLRVVQLDGTPAIDGTIDLSARGATDLFLRGDTVLVLGTTYGGANYGGAPYDSAPDDGGPSPSAGSAPDDAAPMTSPTITVVPSTTTTAPTATTTTAPTTTVPPTSVAPTTALTTTTTAPTATVLPVPPPFAVATTITTVSIADPALPAITASADLEGTLVTAREQGGRARVVVQGTPVGAERLSMSTSGEEATSMVDDLAAEDLLPRSSVAGVVEPVGGCDDVLVAASPSVGAADAGTYAPTPGLSTVTVLTVGDDLSDLQPVSIQGSAETVYASTDSLFVTASSWDQAGSRTDVHRFDLAADGPAAYTGSGRAPGTLLDQFSLSERDGALRLVTTLDGGSAGLPIEPGIVDGADVAIDTAPVAASSARLTVLDTAGTLDEIGHLDGMGVGEQVQSVRFLDDVAYVVTFRQTDPLYAVDLSDPRAPTLLGQLKIPGFSEYLHPVGDGLLLGVGRQVDPGSGMDQGLKISLFDVSDPATMTEVDQILLPTATSEVSSDHRAFLWDPQRSQAVIPVEDYCGAASGAAICDGSPRGAALVIRATGAGLEQVGRFSHEPTPGWALQPTRSVMVGDDLWTISIGAIGRSDADAPSSVDLLRY